MERFLRGRTAFVTGASRGIGKAIARRLAMNGANLTIIARTTELLDSLARELESLGIFCLPLAVDVSKDAELESAMEKAHQRFGTVDILVNNAGVYVTEPIDGHSLQIWRETFETNLTSALCTCRTLVGPMKKNGWGRIINISSISGSRAEAYGGAYSASKFGMIGLTQAVALESARYGVTANAVCPGWVRTDMAHSQLTDERWCNLNELDRGQSEEMARLSVPQMRMIEPDEIAGLVSFLCSEDARGITGQSITVCGGLSLN